MLPIEAHFNPGYADIGWNPAYILKKREYNLTFRRLQRAAENFTDKKAVDSRPIYDVRCGLQTIEWTRNHKDAHSAFKDAAYPCEIWRVEMVGERAVRKLIERKLPPGFQKA